MLTSPFGTKLLLTGSVRLEHGFVLLSDENCRVLGGNVAHLVDRWANERAMALAACAVAGKKKQQQRAPAWIPFDRRGKAEVPKADKDFKSLRKEPEPEVKQEANAEFDQMRSEEIERARAAGEVSTFTLGRGSQQPPIVLKYFRTHPPIR